MEKTYDVVIIGGGPAGYSAALYTAREGLSTLVIEKMGAGGQMTTTDVIDNYPGFDEGIDGFELGAKMQSGAHRFGAETAFDEVLRVFLKEDPKRIVTYSGEILARSVIIATGADPAKLSVEGEDGFLGKGLHYCAHCDGRFYKDKTVAVVGGGNSAASDALYLSHLAKKVYLIHRRDSLRATPVYHAPLMKAENVEILWNKKVEAFLSEGRITGAVLRDTRDKSTSELYFDGLFVSVGRKPNTALFAEQLELDEKGYIVADESTKTNIPGVFAAGDLRTKALRQVVTAAADGAVAAHFASEYLSL